MVIGLRGSDFEILLPALRMPRAERFRPVSGTSAKAAQEVNDQRHHEEQSERTAAKQGATNVKATATEQEEEHNK